VRTDTKESQTEKLIDRLMEIISDQNTPEIKTFVTHRFPDDDGWLCLWIAKKFIPKTANAGLVFVNAGETLPGSEGDLSVFHFDTGGGENDQHGKGLKRSCSAVLLVKRLRELGHVNPLNEAGLKPLLEMVTAVDNVEPLPPTSIHFAIEGYPRLPEAKNRDGTINWQWVQQEVFRLFDIAYSQETLKVQNRENLAKFAEWTTLPNGLKVAYLPWHPGCKDAAFEKGAHAAVWTISRGKTHFYTGISTNRKYPLYLDNVAAALRDQEAKVRQIDVRDADLHYVGQEGPINVWYLHDSKKLILNGSRTWKPTEDEYTRLAPRQIVGLILRALSAIPSEIVSRWNSK
jgi:hypothetical protein